MLSSFKILRALGVKKVDVPTIVLMNKALIKENVAGSKEIFVIRKLEY